MSRPVCLVNGVPADQLGVSDRAVQYGDGLFETIGVRDARPAHLERHLRRLQAGCERLRIRGVDWSLLEQEIRDTAADATAAVLKVVLSRGVCARGYAIDDCGPPTRIVGLHPWPEWPAQRQQQGVRLRTCSLRLSSQPLLAGIKHLNRLEQVMARAEWNDPAIAEGLMLDPDGHLVEGTMSNVFLVRDGALVTPLLDRCGVSGVMRSVIIDCARRLGIEPELRRVDAEELRQADELFVCNSLIGIWPAVAVDGRRLATGELSRRLQSLLEDADNPDDANWYSM